MCRVAILKDRKAQSLHDGQLELISNPLYQGRAFSRARANEDELTETELLDYILVVYPKYYDSIGLFDYPHYQGTLVYIYKQTYDLRKPRYLIWINRPECDEVIYAHYITDLLTLMDKFTLRVIYDIFVDVYQVQKENQQSAS